MEVRPDFDGESRVAGLELILNMDIRMYEEDSMEYVDDAYGIEKEIELTRKDSVYKKAFIFICGQIHFISKGQIPFRFGIRSFAFSRR